MSFDIRQLRHALAAADHGSFYRAARALGVEQSTLSRSILKLERSLGAELFIRTHAGVTTTVAGKQFVHSARAMVASADRMIATTLASGRGLAGKLVVGFSTAVAAGNLRATLLAAREAHPGVSLQGIEADRSMLFAGLDSGEIDVAVLLGEVDRKECYQTPFWSERIFVSMSISHPLAQRELIYWTDLRGQSFVLPCADPGPDLRNLLLGRVWQSGVHPDVQLHPVSREAILSLIGETDLMCVTCEGTTGARFPNLVYRPVHGEQGAALIAYSGYWRPNNTNPALKRFLDFVRRRYALSFELGQVTQRAFAPEGQP